MLTGAERSKPEGIREPGSVGVFEGEHQLAAGVVIQDCRALYHTVAGAVCRHHRVLSLKPRTRTDGRSMSNMVFGHTTI